MKALCSIIGCSRQVHAKGMCEQHYRATLRPAKKVNLCGCGCLGLTQYTFLHGHHTRLFTSDEQRRRGRQNDGSSLRDSGSADWYRKVQGRHEHRRVVEESIGRPLGCDEVIHHINGNKKDNQLSNLQVMSRREHMLEHLPQMQEARRARRKSA